VSHVSHVSDNNCQMGRIVGGVMFTHRKHQNIVYIVKGVAKKKGCFKFHNFGLSFLKESERYPFLLLRI
jgi:hypothetical protein